MRPHRRQRVWVFWCRLPNEGVPRVYVISYLPSRDFNIYKIIFNPDTPKIAKVISSVNRDRIDLVNVHEGSLESFVFKLSLGLLKRVTSGIFKPIVSVLSPLISCLSVPALCMEWIVPQLITNRTHFFAVNPRKELQRALWFGISSYRPFFRHWYNLFYLLKHLMNLFNCLSLGSLLNLYLLSLLFSFGFLLGLELERVLFWLINRRFDDRPLARLWLMLCLYWLLSFFCSAGQFLQRLRIVNFFKSFGLLEFSHPWTSSSDWTYHFDFMSISLCFLLGSIHPDFGTWPFPWSIFRFLLFFYELLFFWIAFRGSILIIVSQFGVVFDILFDNFSEALLEEWVVFFDPSGQSVGTFDLCSQAVVSWLAKELTDQVEYLFEKRRGLHVVVDNYNYKQAISLSKIFKNFCRIRVAGS